MDMCPIAKIQRVVKGASSTIGFGCEVVRDGFEIVQSESQDRAIRNRHPSLLQSRFALRLSPLNHLQRSEASPESTTDKRTCVCPALFRQPHDKVRRRRRAATGDRVQRVPELGYRRGALRHAIGRERAP
jgi:hypothetical protein